MPGSPFPSGGQNPVSLDVRDKFVYVVNEAHPPVGEAATVKPGYTVFTIDADGALTPVPNSTVTTTPGSSAAQILISHDGRFAFGDDFLGFMDTPAVGTLRSFTRDNSGRLTPVAGTPYFIPEPAGGALGLWQHPYQNVLYVGFPLTSQVGVYSIDEGTGALTFKTAVTAGAAACWLHTSGDGNNLYTLNSGENTISIFNTSNALSPTNMRKFALQKPGPAYTAGGKTFTTSQPFSLSFSPSYKNLYVVNQFTNTDFSLDNYNYFHILNVKNDGSLDEVTPPVLLPADNIYRPFGCAVKRVDVLINPDTNSKL